MIYVNEQNIPTLSLHYYFRVTPLYVDLVVLFIVTSLLNTFVRNFYKVAGPEGSYPCRATLTFVTRKVAPAAAIKSAATKRDLACYYE